MTRAEMIEHLEWALRHGDRTIVLPIEDLRRELGATDRPTLLEYDPEIVTSEFGTTVRSRLDGSQK